MMLFFVAHVDQEYTGYRCETNINDCEGIIYSKNNTQCVVGLNSFDCQCKPNFIRSTMKRIRQTDLFLLLLFLFLFFVDSDGLCIEQNPCDLSPCHSNGTCYNLNGGLYRCMCPPTYTGMRCNEDINECIVFPSICRNGGT